MDVSIASTNERLFAASGGDENEKMIARSGLSQSEWYQALDEVRF